MLNVAHCTSEFPLFAFNSNMNYLKFWLRVKSKLPKRTVQCKHVSVSWNSICCCMKTISLSSNEHLCLEILWLSHAQYSIALGKIQANYDLRTESFPLELWVPFISCFSLSPQMFLNNFALQQIELNANKKNFLTECHDLVILIHAMVHIYSLGNHSARILTKTRNFIAQTKFEKYISRPMLEWSAVINQAIGRWKQKSEESTTKNKTNCCRRLLCIQFVTNRFRMII